MGLKSIELLLSLPGNLTPYPVSGPDEMILKTEAGVLVIPKLLPRLRIVSQRTMRINSGPRQAVVIGALISGPATSASWRLNGWRIEFSSGSSTRRRTSKPLVGRTATLASENTALTVLDG
jgi:hypothetical protein